MSCNTRRYFFNCHVVYRCQLLTCICNLYKDIIKGLSFYKQVSWKYFKVSQRWSLAQSTYLLAHAEVNISLSSLSAFCTWRQTTCGLFYNLSFFHHFAAFKNGKLSCYYSHSRLRGRHLGKRDLREA